MKSVFIYFDVGDTLLHITRPPGEIYAEVFSRWVRSSQEWMGEKGLYRTNFSRSWQRMGEVYQSPDHRDRYSLHPGKTEGYWKELITDFFQSIEEKPPSESEFREIFHFFDKPGVWELEKTFLDMVSETQKRGILLGIISNWDHRLPVLLQTYGVAHYFNPILVSAHFGYEKPSIRIFQEAERFVPGGSQILYIGDKLELDYFPPRKLGWRSFLYDPKNKIQDPRVETLQTLLQVLERI